EDFPNLLQMECLHTLTIDFKIRTIYSFDYNHMKRHDNALIKIFQLSNLRTLILNNEPLNMDFNFKILPITENLHTLQVHLKTIDNLSDIFICMPKLQRLDLSLKTTFSGDHHVSEFNVPRSLTHLSIEVKYGFRDEIERFIQACTMLTYLNIHIERNQSDFNQWLDGNWWQLLIEKFLPHLKIFHLRIDLIPLPELTMTKQLFESFQTIFWTDIQNKYRTFTIGLLPSDTLPVNCKQHIESSETLSIDLPHNEVSVLPSECVSNIKTLNLKHNSRTAECYILSDLCEIKPYMNDFSTLVHLKLDSECTITPFVFNQLLTMAPCLTRLTISSFPDHLHKMLDFQYPQIRWLDLRRIYISSKIRTKFCSAFPNLEHLMNCHVYSEEDLEVLIENLKYLQNITIHNQAYYFDSDNEFDQWLRKHTHLKNFTFKLINERQIQLWINN
ncbi:unnamed protein product, partial [Adineta steineri]